MYIYKITNIINNKVYIGLTTRSINERFKRHLLDAISGRLDTHLARAIRKYGSNNFIVEEIDTATTQEELTLKEYQWINYYDAVHQGYNETNSMIKCGGNTYKSKTPEEMEVIKEKIRLTKLGGKNPASRKIKCKNIKTNEEYFFDSMAEGELFFGETNHLFISRRCRHQIASPYNQEWIFAYQEDDYMSFSEIGKGSQRARRVLVTNLDTLEIKEYPSYAAIERELHLNAKIISKTFCQKGVKETVILNYKLQLLN